MTKSFTGAALSLALLAAAGPEPTAVRGVAAGGTHNVALSADGTIWTWGDGTPAMTPVPARGLSGLLSFVAGRKHTAILASDGSVWTWNAAGQDQGSAEGLMPAPGLGAVAALSARGDHTLAWKIDGSVWRWNKDGAPSRVRGLPAVLTIMAGAEQDFAVAFDGTVWSWSADAGPRQVPDVTKVMAVASGERQGIALKTDGTVWQWALGTDDSVPTMVSGLTEVVAIAAGAEHHLALRSDGTVWSWGMNGDGQLGDGSEVERLGPAPVLGLDQVASIAAGDRHSLALKRDGSVWGWGDNASGQLADDSGLSHSSLPMLIIVAAKVATPTFSPVAGTYPVDASISVAINCATSGATIRYTTNGSTPNASSSVYTSPITVTTTTTIKAYATAPGLTDSSVASGVFTPQAQTPTFTPAAGTFSTTQNVSLASTTSGVTIRYTTNGNTPTASSPAYTAPIPVTQTTTIKAIAFKTGWANSATATGVFTLQVATPTMSPSTGTYNSNQSVALSTTTSGASIRYTTDGSTPTGRSTLYSAPISVTQTTTIKAIGLKTGWSNSAVGTAVYTFQVDTPTFNPVQGTYSVNQSVALSTTTTGASIRYTTDGSTPTGTSTLYSTPISVSQTTTIKAIGLKTGWSNSAVGTAVYTLQVVAPIMNPSGGTYNANQSITLSTTTTGASIRYTTDGSTPTSTSNLYSTPISVTQTTTIKAIGLKTAWTNSDVVIAVYTLQVATPTFSPGGGTYPTAQTVTIATTTTGATLRYTSDGSDPTSSSSLYTSPISVSTATTLKARGFKGGWTDSAVGSADYSFNYGTLATPMISPPAGPYSSSISVTMTAPSGTIRYTTDGSEPSATSEGYS